MSNKTVGLADALYQYVLSVGVKENVTLKSLREFTAKHPKSNMQIAPEQGSFMHWLAKTLKITKALEVGTFTGYSALSVALALPQTGTLIACDVSEDYISLAKPFWEAAKVSDKIDCHIAPALDTLNDLIDKGEENTFDFAFIDANKEQYQEYVECCYKLVRKEGVILVDNTLWGGRTLGIDPDNDKDTQSIKTFNDWLYQDDRFDLSMLPIAEGLTLLRKR